MAKKRRRRRFIPPNIDEMNLEDSISISARKATWQLWGEIGKFYSENIHITRSVDEQLCKMSVKWCAIPKDRRYDYIHTGLGVRWLFDLAEHGSID